jgi:predicted transcriptional regulator YdeE
MPEPELRSRAAFTVLGIHARIDPATADWDDLWRNRFMPRVAQIRPLATDECVYGVYLESDEEGLDEFWAGMAVPGVAVVPEGLSVCEVAATLEAVFPCTMATIGSTWRYIHDEWLPASPYRHHCDVAGFERYPPGADRGEAPVTIHVPLVRRTAAGGAGSPP